MNISIIQFNGGEFTPQIDARSDLEKYKSGCRRLKNMLPRIYGTAERRPGTKFIHKSKYYDVGLSVLPTNIILQDYFNTGNNEGYGVCGNYLEAQIFTAGSGYNITSIKLKLLRGGSCADLNFVVGIKGVSEELPAGEDLCSGLISAATVDDYTPAWTEITFDSSHSLIEGTQYAIVCSLVGGNDENLIAVMYNPSGGYSDGNEVWSLDSGANWLTEEGDMDLLFETYGE